MNGMDAPRIRPQNLCLENPARRFGDVHCTGRPRGVSVESGGEIPIHHFPGGEVGRLLSPSRSARSSQSVGSLTATRPCTLRRQSPNYIVSVRLIEVLYRVPRIGPAR